MKKVLNVIVEILKVIVHPFYNDGHIHGTHERRNYTRDSFLERSDKAAADNNKI